MPHPHIQPTESVYGVCSSLEKARLSTFLASLYCSRCFRPLQLPQGLTPLPALSFVIHTSDHVFFSARKSHLTTHQCGGFLRFCLKVPSTTSPHVFLQSWEEWSVGTWMLFKRVFFRDKFFPSVSSSSWVQGHFCIEVTGTSEPDTRVVLPALSSLRSMKRNHLCGVSAF